MLLTYIGNPSSHRQGQTFVTVLGCLTILGVRGITVYAEGVLRTNAVMVYVVWGVPILQIAFSSFLLATDRTAVPSGLLEKVDEIVLRFNQFIEPIRNRIFGQRMATESV